jgi:hypothetical protein
MQAPLEVQLPLRTDKQRAEAQVELNHPAHAVKALVLARMCEELFLRKTKEEAAE